MEREFVRSPFDMKMKNLRVFATIDSSKENSFALPMEKTVQFSLGDISFEQNHLSPSETLPPKKSIPLQGEITGPILCCDYTASVRSCTYLQREHDR